MATKRYTPRQVEESIVVVEELDLKPNEKWLYCHSDLSWQYIHHRGWLPELSTIPFVRGANGVEGGVKETSEGPQVWRDPSRAVARAERKGKTVIRPNDPRLGEYRNYIFEVPTKYGRPYYLTQWETPTLVGNRVEVETDNEGWYDFLEHLIASGIVAPMSETVLKIRIERLQKKVNRLEEAVAKNPAKEDRLTEARMHLAEAPKAWVRQFGGKEAPTVKRRVKTVKAADQPTGGVS